MRAATNHFIDRAERWPAPIPIVVLVSACLLMTVAAIWA